MDRNKIEMNTQCPQCRVFYPFAVEVCANCGFKLISRKRVLDRKIASLFNWVTNPGNGWKTFGISFIFAAVLVGLTFLISSNSNTIRQEFFPSGQANLTSVSAAPAPKTSMELLANARRLLDNQALTDSERAEALRYLQLIPASAAEYSAAQILIARLTAKSEPNYELNNGSSEKDARATNKSGFSGRRKAVERLEREINERGGSLSLTLEGKSEDTLRVKSPLMSQEVAYQLVKGTFLSNIQTLGIKTVIFTDGKKFNWTHMF